MHLLPVALLLALCVACATSKASPTHPPRIGTWRAVLASPGGELPFELRLSRDKLGWHAQVRNGEEVIPCGAVRLAGESLSIALEPYDSGLFATVSEDGRLLTGEWRKFLDEDREARLPFRAVHGDASRFPLHATSADERERLDGRWSVDFASDEWPAVGLFQAAPDGSAHGTFLTALGDYRYLAGSFDGERLRLSCFDGGHAFLFEAMLQPDGSLVGDFWSRDSWHEGWTARRDADATLEDPFGLAEWKAEVALQDLRFPDLGGAPRSLASEGHPQLISLFGTWCPNCNDEAVFLGELDERYRDRGLRITGLAFELTDDFERSVRQVRRFQERHDVSYSVLIAGVSDKARASEAFPALDRVRAYPTVIFIDAQGKPRAIHTGFAGPATGDAHAAMRARYELLIEDLLRPQGE